MSTMSYCAFENTSNDMSVSLEKLNDTYNFGEDLNSYEHNAVKRLYIQCLKFIYRYEEIVADNEEIA